MTVMFCKLFHSDIFNVFFRQQNISITIYGENISTIHLWRKYFDKIFQTEIFDESFQMKVFRRHILDENTSTKGKEGEKGEKRRKKCMKQYGSSNEMRAEQAVRLAALSTSN